MKQMAFVLIGVLVVAAVAAGAFYGGMKYGQNQLLQNPIQFLRQAGGGEGGPPGAGGEVRVFEGTPPAGMGAGRFGMAPDTVQSVEGNTVTVSTQDGNVKVQTSDTTLIQKYVAVTVDKLEAGEQVIVSGTKNEDGSITARSIRSLKGLQFEPQDAPVAQP
jgi:hypothetical protein